MKEEKNKDGEGKEPQGLPEGTNPYQRLKYIYNTVKFYKTLDNAITIEDLRGMMNEILKVTKKYKK